MFGASRSNGEQHPSHPTDQPAGIRTRAVRSSGGLWHGRPSARYHAPASSPGSWLPATARTADCARQGEVLVTQAVVYASQEERIAFAGSVQLSSKGCPERRTSYRPTSCRQSSVPVSDRSGSHVEVLEQCMSDLGRGIEFRDGGAHVLEPAVALGSTDREAK